MSTSRSEDVSAKRTVVLKVKSFSDKHSTGGISFKCCNTVSTDQVVHTLGVGGRSSNIPFIKRDTTGRVPSDGVM